MISSMPSFTTQKPTFAAGRSVTQPRFGEWRPSDRSNLATLAGNSNQSAAALQTIAGAMPQLGRIADSLETIAGAVRQYINPESQLP
jgi:hypothetical protein